ncbi:MAG: polymer-forming cytoskeletal protein, partial [Dehalococcoidales bacterium]|nr:polymer-forming cytoskeletal protein [Dehalococcoidales bacterium]
MGVIRFSIIISLMVLLVAFAAVPARAFDARGGQDITIGSGEVINSDLYLGGTNITIDGTVNGDVFAMGQNITINGPINGGVSLAAQTVIVNGNISAGARIGGQTVRVGGSIGRDLIVAASELTVSNTAVIGGDLNSFADNTVIDGRVTGNVTGSMNNLTITGGVNGNITVSVSTLRIASTANIQGNVNYTSGNTANIEPGATIGGTTNRTEPPADTPRRGVRAGIAGAILFGIWGYLAIFIVGLVALALVRRFIFRLAAA